MPALKNRERGVRLDEITTSSLPLSWQIHTRRLKGNWAPTSRRSYFYSFAYPGGLTTVSYILPSWRLGVYLWQQLSFAMMKYLLGVEFLPSKATKEKYAIQTKGERKLRVHMGFGYLQEFTWMFTLTDINWEITLPVSKSYLSTGVNNHLDKLTLLINRHMNIRHRH